MPWRYWRISTTSSRSVSATTLTQGGYSLIQYSGMMVPFGSSTRSTRTVYQSFFARYSRVRTFQGPGSSGKWSGAWWASRRPMMPRARSKTARIIGAVNLPVLVFWRLGW